MLFSPAFVIILYFFVVVYVPELTLSVNRFLLEKHKCYPRVATLVNK